MAKEPLSSPDILLDNYNALGRIHSCAAVLALSMQALHKGLSDRTTIITINRILYAKESTYLFRFIAGEVGCTYQQHKPF